MPESAARINPLRPRVCTIHLCLGEPPLRGARVRANSLVLCSSLTRILTRINAGTWAHTTAYSRDVHTYTLSGDETRRGAARCGVRRHRSPSTLLNPCGYPRPGERVTSKTRRLSTTDLAMFPDPCRDWSQTRRTASPIRRAKPRLHAVRARTTSFTGE